MERSKPTALLGVAIVFFVFVSATAWYKENGLRDVQKLRDEITSLNGEIGRIAIENAAIQRELVSLSGSDRYIEAIAREQLGLVKPGEVVFEFIDADKLRGAGAR